MIENVLSKSLEGIVLIIIHTFHYFGRLGSEWNSLQTSSQKKKIGREKCFKGFGNLFKNNLEENKLQIEVRSV